MMRDVLLVAAGGAVGALARFGVGVLVAQLPGRPMSLGTLAVNVIGCLVIGLVGQYVIGIPPHSGPNPGLTPLLRSGLIIGFLGALTTFSAFGWDTVELLQKGRAGLALANVGANLAFGFGAVWLGMATVRACQ